MPKYFSAAGGVTTGAKSGKRVRYPAGVFEAEAGDLKHCADVEAYQPNKKPAHYAAGVAAGLIDEKDEAADEEDETETTAPGGYEVRPMKAERPGA